MAIKVVEGDFRNGHKNVGFEVLPLMAITIFIFILFNLIQKSKSKLNFNYLCTTKK